MDNENDIKIDNEKNNETVSKGKKAMDYAKRVVRQTIRKIASSGKVQKLNGEVVEINVDSKKQLKDAVELQIIRPYTSSSKLEYSLEWKEQIKDLIRNYDEIFEEEYEKYLGDNATVKNTNVSAAKDTNILEHSQDENTTKPLGIDSAILESAEKLNELIKRTVKPINRTYVGKINIKLIKPFTVIDGKKTSSSGKIGKLQDRYNVDGRENKQRETVLDINYGDEKEDIAK